MATLNDMLLTNIHKGELNRWHRAMTILTDHKFTILEGSAMAIQAETEAPEVPEHYTDTVSCTCKDHFYRHTICKHMEARIWLWMGEYFIAEHLYKEVA